MRAFVINGVVALFLTTVLGGASCTTSGGGKLQPVNLPKEPACMSPVARPSLAAGTSVRVALLKTDLALDQANANIRCSKKWYQGVRRGYAKPAQKS